MYGNARQRMRAKVGRCEGAPRVGTRDGEQAIVERLMAIRAEGPGWQIHAQVDTSDKFLAKGREQVQLVFYENGEEKHQTITFADVKLRLAECSQVLLQLVELQKLIKQAH